MNDGGLRFSDEFIRHKVLDLIGDLALLGCPILGHIIAKRAGHTQHLAFMKTLIEASDCWEIVKMETKGNQSVFQKISSTTKTMSQQFVPFFVPQPMGTNHVAVRASC